MDIYPSILARDAALDALPSALWTQQHRTFPEFTADLDRLLPYADADAKPRREARGVGLLALMANAARNDRAKLERVTGSTLALQAATKLISSWKAVSLRPEDLREAAGDLAARPDTARVAGIVKRLARLYELYEQQLGSTLTDREALERQLLRRLEACEKIPQRLLKPGESVCLHGFHKLPYIQMRIVKKLLRLKHDVTVDAAIFSTNSSPSNQLSGLAASFGSARLLPSDSVAVKKVQRIEAPNPYAEVYEIGRRVRRWIAHDKMLPASIAVAFRDLGPYSQAVHDVFKRLEIPFYERRGEPAQFQPLVRAALSAVDACVGNLQRRDVFRFLCAGPVNVSALASLSQMRLDPETLHALALDAGIDRFYGSEAEHPASAWKEKLKRFLPDTVSAPKIDSATGSSANKGKRPLAARALGTIIDRLNSMRVIRSASAHVEAWRTLFDVCGLNAAKCVNASSKERLALNALDSALAAVADIPGAASETCTLETFAELLNSAIQDQSVRADGTDRSGVRVLNFYDMRGQRFKRVAIGGMAEGLCPARSSPDPLLGSGADQELRHALAARLNDRDASAFLQPRLSHESEQDERALFRGTVLCAEDELLLLRPQRGENGSSIGASEYWDEFDAVVEKCAPIHPAPPLSECLTPEEIELRAAWVLGSGTTLAGSENEAALGIFQTGPRLKNLAQLAGIERARYQFFLDQSIAAAQIEKGIETSKVSSAGIYDGVIATLKPRVEVSETGQDAGDTFSKIAGQVARRLAPKGGSDPMLSPSDLEKLAACPFRFMLERVCRFNHRDEPADEISPLDAGQMWHTVLNQFYAEEIERAEKAGNLTVRLDRKRRPAYLKTLLFLAGKELFRTSSEQFIGHPGLWKLQEERLRALLAKWLDCEFQEPSDGFFCARVEFDFGPDAATGACGLTVPSGSGTEPALKIKGRMDRLDFKTEFRGGAETVVGLRVLDYKLGRGSSYGAKTKVGRMTELLSAQLPIYLAAAVDYLFKLRAEKNVEIDFNRVWAESRAGYYSLRDTPFSSRGLKLKLMEVEEWPLGDLRSFLDASAPPGSGSLYDLSRRHFTEILSGNFPVRPLDCGGLYCPSRHACRYQAIPAMEEDEQSS